MRIAVVLATLGVTACTAGETPAPAGLFFERLSALCDGNAYAGVLVSDDAADADFKSAVMRMGPATCDGNTIRIPFTVDDDRSRTWIITRTLEGVRLKHDHRHRDGSEDVVTQYGGDSTAAGTVGAQDFPADDETKTLFTQEGLEVSNQNTWRLEVEPNARFTYQMSRPERLFRVEFDLATPVEAPLPTWGEVPVE